MPGLRALWTVAWHVAGRRLSSAILLAGVCVPVLAQESVSLQLRWRHQFQFAGYYAALHQGFYREAGLDVTLKEGGPGTDVPAEVLAGRSEFGVGVSSLVIDYLKGKPVLLLGPIFQHSPNMLLLYGRDRHLTDLAGPAGGRVMLMRGGQDMELKAMFLNEGIALDKLRIVETGRHLDDFLERRIEALNAYVSNEPYILEQRDIPYTMLRPQTYGMDFYGDVLFTRRGLADERPEVVAAFRAASMRGWRYALDHPDEIVDLILRHYNTQNKTRAHLAYEARQVRRLINPEIIEIGHSNPGRWRHIADTYQKTGLVHAARPLEDFFYQPGRGVDLAWLYRALAVIGAIALVVGGVAAYVHRVNRRLARALDEKSRSEERHRIIFQTSASAGFVWREGFIVTDWNRQAERTFGWKREEVLGRSFVDFLLPVEDRQRLEPEFMQMLQENVLPHSINDNLTRDGRVITCEWLNTWLPERAGESREVVSLATDITERVRLENEIRQLAFFDPLTGLPNRRLLQDRLGRVLAAVRRDGRHGALLFIDLDNLKPLNDTLGHETGDQLLKQVAQRLEDCVRHADTVARYGGDEFVVLLGDLEADAAQARGQAEDIAHKILRRLAEPYRLTANHGADKIEHNSTASIGMALFDGHEAEETILRRADVAMYRAKESGRNRVVTDAGPVVALSVVRMSTQALREDA